MASHQTALETALEFCAVNYVTKVKVMYQI